MSADSNLSGTLCELHFVAGYRGHFQAQALTICSSWVTGLFRSRTSGKSNHLISWAISRHRISIPNFEEHFGILYKLMARTSEFDQLVKKSKHGPPCSPKCSDRLLQSGWTATKSSFLPILYYADERNVGRQWDAYLWKLGSLSNLNEVRRREVHWKGLPSR